MKKINKKILTILASFLLIICFLFLGIEEKSYALTSFNTKGDYILNPKWLEYMELDYDEQIKYEVIPEKFIYQYKETDTGISLFNLRNNYPNYYNLNDYGWSTFPEHQYGLGLCWAFAGLSSIETYMLKSGMSNIQNPIKFSKRQLDYASANKTSIKEGYNPYSIGNRTLGRGASSSTTFVLMATGISPVTTDIYGWYNEEKDTKSLNEVINLNNVEYVVDSYVNYGSIDEYTTTEEREAWIKEIKNHVLNYGSVSITTIGPLAGYGGSCLYKDKSNNNLLNVSGECNPLVEENTHAMAIIGWDDDYKYEYCRLEDETSNDLTNCSNIVSGTGAFILKNSYGDTYPYPYIAYTSNVDAAYGVTKVSLKNWDTNYDISKYSISNYEHKISTITYYKSSNLKEKLKKISFYTNTRKNLTYNIYLSVDGSNNYDEIGNITTDKIGLNTLDVDSINLDNDKFSIKITSTDGYIDQIYAFTEDVDSTTDIKLDTIVTTGTDYSMNIEKFSLYTVTKNIENGSYLEYKFIDENGNDITHLATITKNIVLNNAVNPEIKFNSSLPIGNITLETLYDGKIYNSTQLKIVKLKNLWSGGTGTIEDPFLINNAEDFIKIYTNEDYMQAHYKLINDLDFSNIKSWNIGSISNYQVFSGSLDGDNHTISKLISSSNLPSLFYSTKNATIKNLIFSDINWNIEESGWGNLISILAYDSIFENITITKTVNIEGKSSYAGGIVATAYNSKFRNIANYANITTNYDFYGKAAGIVVESYGSEITTSYNYGNITATTSQVGGIVAYLSSDPTTSNVGIVKDVYNQGKIISNSLSGGIVGNGNASLIDNSYNIYSFKNTNENIANIIGNAYGMIIKNTYYLVDTGKAILNDEEEKSTIINVSPKTEEQLKQSTTYLNFDFENIWTQDNSYPYFKNINYYYLHDIKVTDELNLDLDDTYKIEITYLPNNTKNKDLDFEIIDSSIISINEEGVIKALKEGNTILKVKTKDGSNIEKEIKITVIEDKINLNNYEIVNNKYIKIKPNFVEENFITSIYNGNKYNIKVIGENEVISTGDKVQITKKDGTLVKEYITFILGDITGTGKINVSDVAKLYQYIKGKINMEEEFKNAANVVKDDELKINDVAKLYQYIKEKIKSLEEEEE